MPNDEPPAWIETIPAEEWSDALAPMAPATQDHETGEVDHILLAHSLHPAGLAGHLGVYRAAMAGTSGLRKVDRELVAMVVSKLNGCEY